MKHGIAIGRAIEELISIISPATFYRWMWEEKNGKPKPKNPKGGQPKPKELRELDRLRNIISIWDRLPESIRKKVDAMCIQPVSRDLCEIPKCPVRLPQSFNS